ncbi:MAG: S8 family serine peptidase [Bdellovibrionales bacterium]|nr:S8 family serine peptidase [Bdellovibrionales bacterium]
MGKKMMSKLCLAAGVLGTAFSGMTYGAPNVVPGELIVKLKPGQENAFFSKSKSLDIELKETISLSYGKLFLVRYENSIKMDSVKKMLESNDEVISANPNFIYSIVNPIKEIDFNSIINPPQNLSTPNDPRFGELWGLNNTGSNDSGSSRNGVEGADIGAMEVWDLTRGSREVRVAVIDTGVDYRHPDLAANMWVNEAEQNGEEGVDDDNNGFVDDIHGYDFANNDGDPLDGHGHGTHCSGTIGAVHNNETGVAGVMNDVTIVAVKFLSDGGSGTTANAIKAIDYATTLDVDIMSNSWGGGGFSEDLKNAIVRASEKGIIFTAAAGNSASDNDSRPHYPSNYDVENIVSVAAHGSDDTLASFSCYGSTTVHIAAPGQRILSTVKNGGYSSYSGTSMATPHVSGALGLLVAHEGRIPHAEMRERLMQTSEPIRAYRRKTISGGRLNAYNLVTDTRPDRNEPDPSLWETVTLEEAFESAHPYEHRQTLTREVTIPGVKFMRAKVSKYDLEKNYDFLRVRNSSRAEIEKISGAGESYTSDYVEGDTMIIEFTSDTSVARWGFIVNEVEVIRE